jgi:hypothetical protein
MVLWVVRWAIQLWEPYAACKPTLNPTNTPKFKTINDFEMINNNPPFFGWEKSWKGVWGYM